MNIIFIRHGEAEDNANDLLLSNPIRCSTLTKKGIEQIKNSIASLGTVDKIYTSPLIRTLQTTRIILENQKTRPLIVIDNRIKEINWGKNDGRRNNQELDKIREQQASGDYFIRFGFYGENRYEIESRLISFLLDLDRDNCKNNTILVVSHGTIISFMKRLLQLPTKHAQKGEFDFFENVNFNNLRNAKINLRHIKQQSITRRIQIVQKLPSNLHNGYLKIAKDFNNIEFSDDILTKLISGITRTKISKTFQQIDKRKAELILICVFRNFSNFIEQWLNHYIDMGVKNFVLINNQSSDDSIDKIKTYKDVVNIDLLKIEEKFDCYKYCGWVQNILEEYGANKWYLVVDSDELFVFNEDCNDINTFTRQLKDAGIKSVKALMLDMYSDKPFNNQKKFNDFIYADKLGYKREKQIYGTRYYGGMRERIFNIKPSLQKIPLVYYTGQELLVNNHFYFPYHINEKSPLRGYLKHYKFLASDLEYYTQLIDENIHWNNSSEYKVYLEKLKDNPFFYDKEISEISNNIKIS